MGSSTADLVVFTHPACAGHDPVPGHPERPQRLAAVMAAFTSDGLRDCQVIDTPLATRESLLRVHEARHVERVFVAGASGRPVRLDPDTAMAPGSLEAALYAAGAATAAVDHVMQAPGRRAFCAVRPPGHHATRATAMGFCLFNNIAVGAAHALAVHGLERVAIVDFDVHHGNGTQAVFEADADLFYASTHQFPLYPGTGARHENGVAGNVVNLPLRPFAGSAEFREAVENILLPRLEAFAPELLLISAGFDAHRADPLAQLQLTDDDYHWVTEQLLAVARKTAQGRVVSALEGGYALSALASASAAHVRALMLG